MPKSKAISRENMGTRLFSKDEAHIRNLVKKNRFSDKRFENNSAAIRYYVELGIAAENSSEGAPNSLDEKIIQASQKRAISEQLVPLTEAIEILFERMKIFDKNQTNYFTDSENRFNKIEEHFKSATNVLSEQVIEGIKNISAHLAANKKTSDETLRNLIVLRTVFYVFLLGHKTGRIEPGKENMNKWGELIKLAHEHANRLSVDEVKQLSTERLEAAVIRKMASDIFMEIKQLPDMNFTQ